MTSFGRQLVVTGASGFLGSEIVRLAVSAGWQVRAFVRDPQTKIDGVQMFVGEITDFEALSRACRGASAVVHAAGLAHVYGHSARDYARFKLVNEEGTDNLVKAATKSGVFQIVLASSVSVYGLSAGIDCDERATCRPRGAYAVSKWRAELKAIERMAKGGGSLAILRLATIYGEGDRGNVARLIRALERGRFVWPGSGLNRKSLIYKEDAGRACLRALECPVCGTSVFNIAAPPVTMRETVSTICQVLGRPIPRLRIPGHLLKAVGVISRRMHDPWQLGQLLQKFTHDDVYDGSKFNSTFDFSPSVLLSEGMRREVQFIRANFDSESLESFHATK